MGAHPTPARVANYDPRWLDALCLSGAVGWGRISPHPAWSSVDDGAAPRRVIPTNAAPITFYIRETADWLPHALAQQSRRRSQTPAALSPEALQLRPSSSNAEPVSPMTSSVSLNLTRQQTQQALWELATAGLAAADGFDQLRAMHGPAPQVSTALETPGERPTRNTAGRWSLLSEELARRTPTAIEQSPPHRQPPSNPSPANSSPVTESSSAISSPANPTPPNGVIFLASFAVSKLGARSAAAASSPASAASNTLSPKPSDSLRAARHPRMHHHHPVAAADPANLAGIVIPGERIPARPRANKFSIATAASISTRAGDEVASAESPATMPPVPSPARSSARLGLF